VREFLAWWPLYAILALIILLQGLAMWFGLFPTSG
jgi:hypothetical protein